MTETTSRPTSSKLPPAFPKATAWFGTPTTSVNVWPKDTTPHSSRSDQGTSSKCSRSTSSRISRRRAEEASRSRSESAREPDAHADMGKAMKALFKTFDHDRSGSVNLDEFVQAQELALELYGSLPGSVERRNVVEQYLLARTPGESELRGGGLSLEAFVRWQLQWQSPYWATGEELEITERCRKLREHIKTKRSFSNSQRPPRYRPRRRLWPPQVPREHRATRSARRYVSGGGMSTAAKGFVQPPNEVGHDISAYEDVQNLKEESSDPEEIPERKADELQFILEADVLAIGLAKKLYGARLEITRALVESQREVRRVQEQHVLEELQSFVCSLSERYAGQMLLRGCVVRGQAMLETALELQDLASKSVVHGESGADGIFQLCTPVSPQTAGSDLLLIARHPASAPHYRRVAGEGLTRCRLDLLPLHSFYFEVDGTTTTTFEDKLTGARFQIPLLLKHGQPFEGQAKLSYSVTLPDFGSRARHVVKLKRRDTARDHALADACRATSMASTAVPARLGRSLAGAQVPVVLCAAVFARLFDAEDRQELTLSSPMEVSLPCHSLALQSLPDAPSIWCFQEEFGTWCQTADPLSANQQELPMPPEPEEEIAMLLAMSSAQRDRPDAGEAYRSEREDLEVLAILKGHEEWIQQLRREKEEHLQQICYCGFRAKEAIQHFFRKHRKELRFAEPPKRLFAHVEPEETGYRQCFPYRTLEDVASSAARAAGHAEVVVSHHFMAVCRYLDPSPEIAKDMGLSQQSLFTFQHYNQVAGDVLPHLRHVAKYLVDGARLVHSVTGDSLSQAAKIAIKLAALELLVNCFICPRKPKSSSPCTMNELWEAIQVRGGDVATAFLYVALQQATRDSLAKTRRLLRQRNPQLWASFLELLPSLRGETLEDMDSKLSTRAKLQELQEMVRHRGGRCRAAELHRALRELPARRAAAAERLESCREAKTRAREAAKEASKKLAASLRRWKKAEQENDLGSKLDETKMVKQLEILAQNAKEEAARCSKALQEAEEEAELERTMEGSAQRLAQEPDPHMCESDDVQKAWKEVLSKVPAAVWEYGYPNALTFSFQVREPGQWHAIGRAEVMQADEASDAPQRKVKVENSFFSELPRPKQPVLRTSALVLGIFDGHEQQVVAVEVACGTLGSTGMIWSPVEADGTFCVFTVASKPFELWFTLADTYPARPRLRFGPYMARSCEEVTHLGTLRPSYVTKPGEWRDAVTPAGAFITLPRLELAGTSHETCTCDVQAILEGSSEELSQEISKDLSRQEGSLDVSLAG